MKVAVISHYPMNTFGNAPPAATTSPASSSSSSSSPTPCDPSPAATSSPAASSSSAPSSSSSTGKMRSLHHPSPRASPYPQPSTPVQVGLAPNNNGISSLFPSSPSSPSPSSPSPSPSVSTSSTSISSSSGEELQSAPSATPTPTTSKNADEDTSFREVVTPNSSSEISPHREHPEPDHQGQYAAPRNVTSASPASRGKRNASPTIEEANENDGALCLIVDDNNVNLEVLRFNLNRYGVSYNIATNGEIALEYACKRTYKFIIMDICMPGMDGFQSTEKIRKEKRSLNKNTHIIAHTTLQNPLHYFLDKGLDDLLSKPFSREELLRILNTYAFV